MRARQKIGVLGEELVALFLVKRGHKILDRNFRRPWGELDVVSKQHGVIHFVEVKSVSYDLVTYETRHGTQSHKDRYRPEDNVHSNKIKRLSRIIQTYLNGKHVSPETSWQFDVATVLLDETSKKAKINLLENVIL